MDPAQLAAGGMPPATLVGDEDPVLVKVLVKVLGFFEVLLLSGWRRFPMVFPGKAVGAPGAATMSLVAEDEEDVAANFSVVCSVF